MKNTIKIFKIATFISYVVVVIVAFNVKLTPTLLNLQIASGWLTIALWLKWYEKVVTKRVYGGDPMGGQYITEKKDPQAFKANKIGSFVFFILSLAFFFCLLFLEQ